LANGEAVGPGIGEPCPRRLDASCLQRQPHLNWFIEDMRCLALNDGRQPKLQRLLQDVAQVHFCTVADLLGLWAGLVPPRQCRAAKPGDFILARGVGFLHRQ
jgi:hypothetical protein